MKHPQTPPGVVIHGFLETCASQAVRDLRGLETAPDLRIHALRVRMKKLHALLLLVKPHFPAGTLGTLMQSLRHLRTAFGRNRDQQVLAALKADFAGLPPPGAAATHVTPALLRKARRLGSEAEQLRLRLGALDLSLLTWDSVLHAHARLQARARRRLHRGERDPSPRRLHRLRKAVKNLYYQGLVLRRLMKHAHRCLTLAHRLGSCLGRLHDVDSLLALETSPPVHDRATKRRRHLQHKALRLGHRLFKGHRMAGA